MFLFLRMYLSQNISELIPDAPMSFLHFTYGKLDVLIIHSGSGHLIADNYVGVYVGVRIGQYGINSPEGGNYGVFFKQIVKLRNDMRPFEFSDL